MYKGLKYFFCEPNRIILYINIVFIVLYFLFLFFECIWSSPAARLFERSTKYLVAIFALNIVILLLCIFLKNNTFSLIANWGTLILLGIVEVMVYQANVLPKAYFDYIYYTLLLAVSVCNTINMFLK